MELEIFSLIGGFPFLPGPLERSSTVQAEIYDPAFGPYLTISAVLPTNKPPKRSPESHLLS